MLRGRPRRRDGAVMRGGELASNLAFWLAMPTVTWTLVRRLGWGLFAAGASGVAVGVVLAIAVSWLMQLGDG